MSRIIVSLLLLSLSVTILLAHYVMEATAADDVVSKNETTGVDNNQTQNPKNVTSLVNEGLTLYNLGNYSEAVEVFDRALDFNPNDVDALINKARAFYNLERYEEALAWFDKDSSS